jgi:hypothetical protein
MTFVLTLDGSATGRLQGEKRLSSLGCLPAEGRRSLHLQKLLLSGKQVRDRSENQRTHGPCTGDILWRRKVSQCRRLNRSLLTGYEFCCVILPCPIDVVRVGVNAISSTASKLVEPAGERYAGGKCPCPWMSCGANVCKPFVMASKRASQYAAAAVASASAESEFILSIEEIVENQKASGGWMADSIVVEGAYVPVPFNGGNGAKRWSSVHNFNTINEPQSLPRA